MRTSNLFVLAAAIGALAGCASSGPDSPVAIPGEPRVLRESALTELTLNAALLDDALEPDALIPLPDGPGRYRWLVPPPLYKLVAQWAGTVPHDCIIETGWRDDDGDGLPADSTFRFDCSFRPAPYGRASITGWAQVTDTDDTDAQSGFRLEFTNLDVMVDAPDGAKSRHVIDGWLAGVVPGAPQSLANGVAWFRDLTVLTETVAASGVVVTGTHDSRLAGGYRPFSGEGDPFAEGLLSFNGGWTFGRKNWTGAGVGYTAPALHWDRACEREIPDAPGFDGGAVEFFDEHENTLRIEFLDCGAWVTSFNGMTL